MATIEEIAHRLNLDKSTVSRALNGKPGRMSEATRQRILAEAGRLGYVPNPTARALASGRTGGIGFVSRPLSGEFSTALLHALALAADEAGENLVMGITLRDTRKVKQTDLLHTGRVDGLLAIPTGLPQLDSADSPWRQAPLVYLLPERATPDVPTVAFDEGSGVLQIAEHLWGLGHRWALYLPGLSPGGRQSVVGRRRVAALRAAWRGFGMDPDLHITEVPGLPSPTGGFDALQEALRRGTPFTAVITYNDSMALGAIAALFASGRLVPDDVSVVGWNDIGEGNNFTFPPLTSLRTSPQDMAVAGLNLLHEIIERTRTAPTGTRPSKTAPEQITLPVTLTIRRSTGPAPAVTGRGRG